MDDWLPQGAQTRRTFVVIVLLVCLVVGTVRFFVIPPVFGVDAPSAATAISDTLGDVIATALAGTFLAVLLLIMFPRPDLPAVIDSVPAHEISRLLESALPHSKRWWFDGSTGRFQRATTLPEMGRHARQAGTSREVTVVLLDPRNDELCRRYATYRGGLQSGAHTAWSVAKVREEVYATILAACVYSATQPLTVKVALKRTMSILRYDLNDDRLVITREGTRDPALSCPAKSFYYDAYLENLSLALKQAEAIDIDGVSVPPTGFDVDSARVALRTLGLFHQDLDDSDRVERIVADATSGVHPYS